MTYHAHYKVTMKDADGITELESTLWAQPGQIDDKFEVATVMWMVRWPKDTFHKLWFSHNKYYKEIFSEAETEEGYSKVNLAFCRMDCKVEDSTHRDQYAERQGY